jgi:predicted Ser/Thr protein kinase
MSDDRARREHELLRQALELPLDQRNTFLEAASRGDAELKRGVEILLQAHASGARIIDIHGTHALGPDVPERLGPYLLVEEIAEGGMGVVYLAEQTEPIRRSVALKVIRPGMATRSVLARFESERQALASLNHPNIAVIYGGGTTEDRRPYFAMEYVDGEPITEFCDRNRTTIGERLKLFLEVCEGVEHAHARDIVHRDLKPSNVMVTVVDDRPRPKIIDFGVAKALGELPGPDRMMTRTGVVIGTPAYMSPEQAVGAKDVDSRADVYSLGVLLYELVSGALPADQASSEKRTLEAPSSLVSSDDGSAADVADKRGTDSRRLITSIRGDLDRIAITALAVDRDRRYASARDLGSDVSAYLDGRPLSALAARARVASRRGVVPAITVAALVVIAGLAALFGFSWRDDRSVNVVTVGGEGDYLTGVDADGNERFKVTLGPTAAGILDVSRKDTHAPGQPVIVADADADGRNEIYVTIKPPTRLHDPARLHRLDGRGRTVWSRALDFPNPFGLNATYDSLIIGVAETVVTPVLVVLGNHAPRYPGGIFMIDPRDGKLLAESWHPGNVYAAQLGDLDDDGRTDLLLGTANNPNSGLGHAGLLMLEIDRGESPGTIVLRRERYVLFPRLEIHSAEHQVPFAAAVGYTDRGTLLVAAGSYAELTYYYFDRDLQLDHIVLSDAIRKKHTTMFGAKPTEAQLRRWGCVGMFDEIPDGNSRAVHDFFGETTEPTAPDGAAAGRQVCARRII